MQKKTGIRALALVLALVLITAVRVTAAQAGHADSLMEGSYAVIGGDEVLTIAPYFLEYGNYVRNYDGVLTTVNADPVTFQPDADAIRAAITIGDAPVERPPLWYAVVTADGVERV